MIPTSLSRATPPNPMKTHPRSALVAAAFLLAAAPRAAALPPEPVHETATEFTTAADLDGNGSLELVVVDKATGLFRVATVNGGNPVWYAPRPSGIAPVTGFGTGPLLAGEPGLPVTPVGATNRDDLAFTSPGANRVNILNAEPGVPNPQPTVVYPVGLMPNFVVPVDIGGAGANAWLDLFTTSVGNDAPNPNVLALTRATGSAFNPLLNITVSLPLSRGNRLLPRTNSPPQFVAAVGRANTASHLYLYDFAAGTAAIETSILNLPAGMEYAAGTFSNRARLTFLLYVPGGSEIRVHPLDEPAANVFNLNAAPAFTLPLGTNQLEAVQVLGGGPNSSVGLILNGGTLAELHAYNGLGALTRLSSFTATAANPFTRFIGSGPGNVHLLSGAHGISSNALSVQWNGTNWGSAGGGPLPPLPPSARQANVAQFQREPFVDPLPALLALNTANDWASTPVFGTNTTPTVTNRVVTVTGESFLGAAVGLGSPSTTTLLAQPGTTHALVSQYAESIAISPLEPPVGALASDFHIAPASGTFTTGFHATLTAANPADRLFYRTNSGPWTAYIKPVFLYRDTVLDAYGQPASGSTRSPVQTARYTFTSPWYAMDSDADGVPDFVEETRGLNPLGGDDSDGDQASDLDEMLSGSNPLNAAQKPPTNREPYSLVFPVDITITPQPFALPTGKDGAATNTPVEIHGVDGVLLGKSLTTDRGPSTPAAADFSLNFTAGALAAVSTPENFSAFPARTSPVEPSARELVGLLNVPAPAFESIPFTPGSPSLTLLRQAELWEAAGRAFLATNPPPRVASNLFPVDTLVAALVERKLDELIPTNAWPRTNRPSLFPHRPADAGRANPPLSALQYIASPARSNTWHLNRLLSDIDAGARALTHPQVVQLRLLNASLYGVCTFSNINTLTNGTNVLILSTYPPLLDTLRSLVESNSLPQPYAGLALFPAAFVSNAAAGARIILDSVQPRPRVALDLFVTANSFAGECGTLLDASGNTVALRDRYGLPYAPGATFNVPQGARVRVTGFEDVPIPACAVRALEVASLTLADVPPGSFSDLDADGLDDSWELAFLNGSLSENGANDHDGDLFNNRAEFLAGTDPANAASTPPGPPPGSDLAADGIPASPEGDALVEDSGDGALDVETDGTGEDGVALEGGDSDGIEAALDAIDPAAGGGSSGGPARSARPAADPPAFPDRLVIRTFGKLGGFTNRPFGVTRLQFADNVLTITEDSSTLGSLSNRVIFLAAGGRPVATAVYSNGAPIRVVGIPPAGASPGRGAAPAGTLGDGARFISNLASAIYTGTTTFGKQFGKHFAIAVSEVVSDAVGGGDDSDEGRGEEGEGEGGEGEGGEGGDPGGEAQGFTSWPKRIQLPNGTVLSNVTSLLIVPVAPDASIDAVSRLSVNSTAPGGFRLHQAGLLRDGFSYSTYDGARIAPVRGGDGETSFQLSQPSTRPAGPAAGTTGLRLRVKRSLDLSQVLNRVDRAGGITGDWFAAAAPDIDLPPQAAADGEVTARLEGLTAAGPLRAQLRSRPSTNTPGSLLNLDLAGASARFIDATVLNAAGTEACRFRLPALALGRLPAGARVAGIQPDLPAEGLTTRALVFRVLFADPVTWTHPVTSETCTGQVLVVRVELRHPVRFVRERPRFFTEGPAFPANGSTIRPLVPFDWGDAPDQPYPTLAARNGARHRITPGLQLGRYIDPERNGHPTALALGDDLGGVDDEDGVAFLTPVTAGRTATVAVRVQTPVNPARLDAFIDFNNDGVLNDPGNQVFTSRAVTNGLNLLTFNVPANATNRTGFARFRLSAAGGLGPAGPAPDGEVEDYRLRFGVTNTPVVLRNLTTDADGRAVVEATLDPDGVFTLESTPRLSRSPVWNAESQSGRGSDWSGRIPGDPVTGLRRFYRLRQE